MFGLMSLATIVLVVAKALFVILDDKNPSKTLAPPTNGS